MEISYDKLCLLTFIGPCIVINFYSKTKNMHQFSIFILFLEQHSTCFQTVFPSIIRSLRLYIQHQVCVRQILLTAC